MKRIKVKVKIGTSYPQHEGKIGVVIGVINSELKVRFPKGDVAYFTESDVEVC